jgi:hypothetical protein
MTSVLPVRHSSGAFDPAAAGRAIPGRARTRAEWVHLAAAGAFAAAAVAVITWQQLVHTPWGLPGHRGVFWFAALIASRWSIDRPGTAIRIAATSSGLILVIDPAAGGQVVPYLVVALLVDWAAAAPVIRRHQWLLLPLAPLIYLAGVLSPFVHNLGISPLATVASGLWFYILGHLLWGAAAGVAGLGAGISGRNLMRHIGPSGDLPAAGRSAGHPSPMSARISRNSTISGSSADRIRCKWLTVLRSSARASPYRPSRR